jgi:hypothetical protein
MGGRLSVEDWGVGRDAVIDDGGVGRGGGGGGALRCCGTF